MNGGCSYEGAAVEPEVPIKGRFYIEFVLEQLNNADSVRFGVIPTSHLLTDVISSSPSGRCCYLVCQQSETTCVDCTSQKVTVGPVRGGARVGILVDNGKVLFCVNGVQTQTVDKHTYTSSIRFFVGFKFGPGTRVRIAEGARLRA